MNKIQKLISLIIITFASCKVAEHKVAIVHVNGHFGQSSIEIKTDSLETINDLINEVHLKTKFPQTYTISAGPPGKRRSFKVPYDYKINEKKIRNTDKTLPLDNVINKQIKNIEFTIIYLPKVD